MQWLGETWVTWLLVAIGGAAGSTLGLLLLRQPSQARLLAATAVACGSLGAVLRAYPNFTALAALLGFGVLGSASSMLTVAIPPQAWLAGSSPWRSSLEVVKRLAIYCVLGVTFAVVGYIAVSVGHTVDVKTR